MLPFGLVLFVAAGPAFRLFTDDPAIVAAGVSYLRVQTVVWSAMAAESVYTGAFAGIGRTVPPLLVNGSLSALRIPLALLFARSLGPDGVWLAIGASTLLKGVVLTTWWTFAPEPAASRDTLTA
jgi:Na+-driven multidrug efflux pump